MITVARVTHPEELKEVFAVREAVFVREQRVPAEEEYDEFEDRSRHFLAQADGVPCGTARWRTTSGGVKLERFAVLKPFRGRGVGRSLVRTVLDDVFAQHSPPPGPLYLHAQVPAMPLYAGFGFEAVGDPFDECGIQHYKMMLPAHLYPQP